ncbi:dihydrodipicolinate synthase family protein [Mesorhizobium sp. YC-39]|uniref:dihydrodipicolinate synthase family protein n=1 Tax=unclassified Mesorhizobium TaxID=325217 RepID=UPI0021E7EBA9|nr:MULTISPECIES: dihydrodipicolinate synthase family protein [unclassified Mesorhizobium]MCV3205434.1 dihydrodipicolinate synthase family protein [Mesorhizobium sp. YC-2]MCV3228167.1 dihydrodipicolinate synthase family protein [Mesorhizobium sp. YC-39]
MSDHLCALPEHAPRGIWGAVMLAVGLDGNIDWSATQDTVARLCALGVHGVYSNGTACEFHCQTEAEFDRLSEMVAQVAGAAKILFQIGISQSNPRVARERLKRVAGLRPSAVQFTLPDWWPPSDEEVLCFVSGLAEAAPRTPLVLYNPPHAKRRLSLETIAALRTAVPSLVGAKLPGGDASWYADMRRELPGFSVFVPGHTLATGYANGAHGSYSNVACLSPTGALEWWALIRAGEQAAVEMQARIQAFLADHVLPFRARYAVSDAALDKAMAAAGGWSSIGPRLLWPYSSVPEEEIAPLATAARTAFAEWF